MSWTRRNVLKSMAMGAGASLAGPLFGRLALGQSAVTPRVVIVTEGNCIEPANFMTARVRAEIAGTHVDPAARWFHRDYRHDAVQNLEGALLDVGGDDNALGPLAGGDGALDLRDKSAVLLGLSSKVTGGGHTTFAGALSCARSSAGKPGGQTIDDWLGERLRAETPFDVLRLGISGSPDTRLVYTACAGGAGKPLPVIADPMTALHFVYGSVASDDARTQFGKRGARLLRAYDDVRASGPQYRSASAQAKMAQYQGAIEEVMARHAWLADPANQQRFLEPGYDAIDQAKITSSLPLERLAGQFSIATQALIHGLSNVVVLNSGSGAGFNISYWPGDQVWGDVSRHELHHGSGGNPVWQAQIRAVTRTHVGLVAQMARQLAAVPEGGGTMLDNTLIIYMSENGEQHHSVAGEWPALLVGGANLGWKTDGRTVVYPGHKEDEPAAHRHVANLFNTVGHGAGHPLDGFGNEGPRAIAGPLGAEIWAGV